MDKTEGAMPEQTESDAQFLCDAVAAMVAGLGYPREIAIAVSVAAGSRLIELVELEKE